MDPNRLASECDVRRLRRSGPGGQNRNKVETAIALMHRPSGISAEANERRSQAENLRVALFRLRINLAIAVRSPANDPGKPSQIWQSRCRSGRILIAPIHDDFPTLLAEALDVLDAAGMDVKQGAETLECTPSQLIKFLKDEPKALVCVNDRRRELGMHPLH